MSELSADRPRPRLSGHLPPPKPWQRNAVFAVLGTTVVMGWIGTALFATLVDRHPLALISLNATPKYLVLTTNSLDWWAFYPVAMARLVVTKPLMWLIGAWYGERAVAWAARRSERSAQVIRWLQSKFDRIGWLVVLITSNNVVCLLAGSTAMPLLLFIVLAAAGTMVRLWLFRAFGEMFTGPIDRIIQFVADHRLPVAIAMTAGIAILLVWQHRSGRSDLDDLRQLDRDTE